MISEETAKTFLIVLILSVIFMTCGIFGVAITQHQGWVLPVFCALNLGIWLKFYINVRNY